MERFDIGIIGAGPAGYIAAIESGKRGFKTVIIDKDKIGGTCLNYGCIPTKTIYFFADILHKLKQFRKSGILDYSIDLKWNSIISYKKEVVSKLIKGIEYLFNKNNVKFIKGKAEITDKNIIVIDNEKEIYAEKLIIATGSKYNVPDIFKNINFYTTDNFWDIDTLPERLIIIGAGVIGIELASILSHFNIKVFLLEKADEILRGKSKKIIKTVRKFLMKNNVDIHTSIMISEIKEESNSIKIIINNETEIKGDMLLLVTGRKPNISFNLKDLGIEETDGFIDINKNYKTSIDNIFAIGDIVNRDKMFAHLASFQAIQVIKQINNEKFVEFNNYSVPYTIFTFPQISGISIINENYEYEKKFVSYISNSMGKIENLTTGFLDINIFDKYIKEITIASNYANEIINFYSFILNNSLNIENIENSILTHPSESELILSV